VTEICEPERGMGVGEANQGRGVIALISGQ
jgi:hypothetical protein